MKKKCSFQKMGTKKHQLKGKRKRLKSLEQITKDKKRRLNEWQKWWS